MRDHMAKERFETVWEEGTINTRTVLRDRDTGVCYLVVHTPLGCGLTPLLDSDGKPMVSPCGP